MKKLLILIIMLMIGAATLNAQGPPPAPPSSANNGGTNGFVGGTGGAPIGNGTFILLALAVAYAGRKVYVVKAAENEE
jgi:hypothetical protein